MDKDSTADWAPGQIWPQEGPQESLADRPTCELEVANTGDRPIQVGSHFHFFEANRALRFERAKAYGMRLAIPAGTAVRFEPGQHLAVTLIALAGERVVHGLGGLVGGPLDDEGVRVTAMKEAARRGYQGA